MPTASFIVTLNLSNLSAESLAATAEDIGHSLLEDGFDVVDSKAYAHPSLLQEGMEQLPLPDQGPTYGAQLPPFGGGL